MTFFSKKIFNKSAMACVLLAVSFSGVAQEVVIKKVANVPADFIKGADISTLIDVEKHGGKFFDQNHKQTDAMVILRQNGFNYVRLRLWVDPKDAQGHPYGGGNNVLATTLELAKRAKAQGFKILLDFHYSDFWTDPGKQFKPKSWEKMDYPQLKTAIHDYSREVIARFRAQGTVPDMVQVGNEMNGGILWPEGKSWGAGGGEFDRLAGLLNAAIAGVRADEKNPSDIKIMLHLAEGTKNDTFRWWFDEINQRKVPYDVIGLSFYTYWNGPVSALQTNMDDISKRYNKDVIVVEVAYGYTTKNCDAAENSFTEKEAKDGGYPGTVQGQADFLSDMIKSLVAVPDHRGKGLFYWEPTWIAVDGAGWATPAGMTYINDHWKEGNARENQALFSCDGQVLPSIKVFN
ncbi:glycoside hydrolase family 53 protein [Rahnella sp. CG8]|uniref:glycoside hydrolase family 53 protein n=1 Tax=Rahnella sp. CG8 TaxID=2726078 RepID=UPI0020346259|nr:arabinogalactan endo-beta-1,4-galactanase [Rahnella sp. CG8]MCM2443967.1 cellulase family glycosylhydrolase [Rahnella sp. CG8]